MRQLRSPLLKIVWHDSWTRAWGWCQGLSGALLLAVSEVNSFVSDPFFKGYLDVLSVPKSVTIGLATLGLITWLAHGRK